MTVPPRPLCVVPARLRTAEQLESLVRCLVSLWGTAGALDAVVVADGPPAPALAEMLAAATSELAVALHVEPQERGTAHAANAGLAAALAQGRDALVAGPDLEFLAPGWLDAMLARTDGEGRPAAVVGARLVRPDRCLEHAGFYFSRLDHGWWPRCAHAPADLPEALRPLQCPVSGSLQLVRHATLTQVGLYDADLGDAADVDLCLRVFAAGLECVYEPAAVAMRHARPEDERRDAERRASAERLAAKWASADLSAFVPELA
jgi:GT2 family glycosyltransferase